MIFTLQVDWPYSRYLPTQGQDKQTHCMVKCELYVNTHTQVFGYVHILSYPDLSGSGLWCEMLQFKWLIVNYYYQSSFTEIRNRLWNSPPPPWPWLSTHHMPEHVSCKRQLCTICLSACAALKNGLSPLVAWWTLLSPCGMFYFSTESRVLTWQLPGTLLPWHPGRWRKTHHSVISFMADVIIYQSFVTNLKNDAFTWCGRSCDCYGTWHQKCLENSQGGWQETISELA